MLESSLRFHKPLLAVIATRNETTTCALVEHGQSPRQPAEANPEDPANRAFSDEEISAIQELLSSINDSVLELESRRNQSLAELQTVAVDLSIAIASRLVNAVIDAEQFGVVAMVEQLIDRIRPSGKITIRIHPADHELLEQSLQGNPPPWEKRDVELVSHSEITRGNCRAESDDACLATNIELEIAELRRQLVRDLEDAQTERRQNEVADQSLRRFPDRRETA